MKHIITGQEIQLAVQAVETNITALPESIVSCNTMSKRDEIRTHFAFGGRVMVSLIRISDSKAITLQGTYFIGIHRNLDDVFPSSSVSSPSAVVTLTGSAIVNSSIWTNGSLCSFTAAPGTFSGQQFFSEIVSFVAPYATGRSVICRLPSRLPPVPFYVSIMFKNEVVASSQSYNVAPVFRALSSIVSISPSSLSTVGGSRFEIYGHFF